MPQSPPSYEQLVALLRGLARDSDQVLRPLAEPYPRTSHFGRDKFQERRYRSEWSATPLSKTVGAIYRSLTFAKDHLYGMAAVLADPSTILSDSTLARASLTSSGTAHYLIGDDITLPERIRRVVNFDLESLHEQSRMLDAADTKPRENFDRAVATCLTVADKLEHPVSQGRQLWNRDWFWIGEKNDSELKRSRALVDDVGDGSVISLGELSYRQGSATIHGLRHGMGPVQTRVIPGETGEPEPVWSVTTRGVAGTMVAPVVGYHQVCRRAILAAGESPDEWQDLTRPRLNVLRSALGLPTF